MLHVPQTHGAIVTATEQAAAVGGESQAVHHGAMALQRRPRSALLAIPQPDRVVKAATGQRASIRTPGHAIHLLRMPHKRLQTASASRLPDLPQLDGAIPARAGKSAAIGGKGQSPHPVGMPPERLHAGSRPGLLPLPQPNVSIKAATGEQAPIRAPGQREDRTRMRQLLEGGAQLRIPEPDGGLMSPTGEQASIRSKGQTEGALGMPSCPEQGTTFDVPQLDAVIKAPAGQRAFVRAEGDRRHNVRMGLPNQVQDLACLAPHPHFASLAGCGPVLPAAADGGRCDSIKGLGKDALTDQGSGQGRVLQLDPLQIDAAQGELRQIQPTQVPAQQAQQRHQVGRAIALGIVGPCAKVVQQREQLLLESSALRVHVPQLREQRSHKEALLGLPHIFLGSGQFQAMVDEAREGALPDLAGYLGEEPLRCILQHH